MSNERYNPYLNSDPLRVGVYVELKNVFPCIPPELVMRQYTKAFGLSECAPASLIDMLFPSDLAAAVPPECTNEAIYESIKRFKSMRLPPIPRENVRNDLSAIHRAQENQQADEALKKHVGVESMFSFSRLCPSTITSICRVHGSGVFAEGHSPSTSPSTAAEDAQLVVGYDTGAVFMWTLKKYAGYLESLRAEEHKLGILGSQYAPPPIESGVSAKLWGGSRVPEGVELLGYHLSGRVVSSTYDAQAALAITGSAEGSMYVWDVLGRYGTGKRSFVRGEAVASVEFAKAVRTRRLCYIKKGSHDGPVSALAIFSNLCISGGADRTVRTWGRTTSTVPDYVPLQKFHMEGWVRSIEASNSRGVQTEDVMVTDDTGYMIGLKASAINTQQLPSARVRAGASTTGGGSTTGALLSTTNGTNSNTHVPSDTPPLLSPEDKEVVEPLQETAEVKSTTPPLTPQPPQSAPPLTTAAAITSDGWCSFSLGRSHHFFSEEAIRIGPRRIQHKEEFTNTTVRLIPMCNYTHLLSLNYSPVARLMDYSKLRVSLKLPHPSLTVSGAEMSTKSASSVYRKEQERRAGIFKEHAEAQPMGKFEATEKKRSGSLEPLKSEPLRFIDGLYVPHNDVVFLLDNRNTVYVWERETNRFLATVTMSAVNEEGRPKRALALLPTGTKHYTEQYKPGGPRKEQEGRYEEMSIPFFVVCDSGVELYYVVPTANPVLEVPAHKDAILGISFAPIQTSLPIDHHATAATEDVHIVPPCEVDIAMVSASIDGTLFLWGKKLQFLRAYNMHDESPYEEDTKSEAGGSPHEVTSFHYSDRWGVAVTGHDNGDVRFWRCDGELTDVEVCPHIHTNTISAMAEGHAPVNNRSLDDEDVLITVSFDGFMGLWSGPERRRAIYKNKLRVSWNELLCVVYCPTKALYVVGDSAGYIFVISTKDMTPLQVSPPPHHGPSLLSADATISTHSGAIVCACLSGDYIITADDEGHIISWKYFSFQISTECFIHLSGGDDEFSGERAEINCIAAIAHQRFLVGTRGGDIFSFDADVQPSPLRFYRHGCEVRSLAIQINGNSFDFVVGGSDGSITYLNEQFLTPL